MAGMILKIFFYLHNTICEVWRSPIILKQYDICKGKTANSSYHISFYVVTSYVHVICSAFLSKSYIGCCGGARSCDKSLGTHRFSDRMIHHELWPIFSYGESKAFVNHWYRLKLIWYAQRFNLFLFRCLYILCSWRLCNKRCNLFTYILQVFSNDTWAMT